MDIWGHFETNVVKVGVQGCPEVGTLENPTSLWCGMGPQGFQPLGSHPKVGTQSFSQFILVRYSLVVPFLYHQSLEQHLSGQGNVTIASSRIQVCGVEAKHGKLEKKLAHPLSHCRLPSWSRIQLGLRRGLPSLQKWTEFVKRICF